MNKDTAMRLGLNFGSSQRTHLTHPGAQKPPRSAEVSLDIPLVQEAERLGYYVVWSAEAYGHDAVVPLAWVGALTSTIHLGTAIMQIPGRTPANAAMAAMTLDALSGGRFIMGLGVSGPQVVEGWHGVPFGKPVTRTREYITILRQIFEREAPVSYHGTYYQVPYQGADATGLGKPLKSILHPRKDLPIYVAAMGPNNLTLAGELADGILPTLFSPERFDEVFRAHLQKGFAGGGNGKGFEQFDVAPVVQVVLGDDIRACWDQIRPNLAFSVGVYGARERNFYNDVLKRYGYEEVANRVQELYLAGHQKDAIAAIPDALVDEIALCGPRERIKERLTRYAALPIQTLNIRRPSLEVLRMMAELVL
jgi:F420-dependent oxidoreductase-like protein